MSATEELYRPGLEGIIAGETSVSAVKQDSLMYRGYEIEALSGHSAVNCPPAPNSTRSGMRSIATAACPARSST
jgi:citrate synthase